MTDISADIPISEEDLKVVGQAAIDLISQLIKQRRASLAIEIPSVIDLDGKETGPWRVMVMAQEILG